MVVAVAANVAVDDAAGTGTEAGTVSAGLLTETGTVTPPVGAGAERVRVQVEDAPASRVVELHANVETTTAATKLKVAVLEAPFNVAVMVAGWVVVGLPAVAVNVAEAAAAATVTEAGTVSKALLSDRTTTVPPAGAGWFRVTVHVLEAPARIVVGLQAKSVRPSGGIVVIVPPVAAMGSVPPDGVAPNAPVMLIEVAVVPAEIVTVTTAIRPVGIRFVLSLPVLSPVKKHI
jgi:hypothetical protein